MTDVSEVTESASPLLRAVEALRTRGYSSIARKSPSVQTQWKHARQATLPDLQQEDIGLDILAFQNFYGLLATGELDEETSELLMSPHCGVPDPVGSSAIRTGSGGWSQTTLTYSTGSFPTHIAAAHCDAAIDSAFGVWSGSSKLRFSRVSSGANIAITFGAINHGDGFPFNQATGELAHAFAPDYRPTKWAGQAHFDLGQNWSVSHACPPSDKDLMTVAIHEIGHALGLDHVGIRNSVMFANYQGVERSLYSYDIAAINAIYP